MTTGATTVKSQLGPLALETAGQGRSDRRLQRFHAKHGAAAGAMKMRVPVRFIDRGTETPDAVGTGNAMGKRVGHQPIERTVKGYAIVQIGRASCRERV